MPLHGNGFRQEANLAVACLVLDFFRYRQSLAVRAQGLAEVGGGTDMHVLADAEFSLRRRARAL